MNNFISFLLFCCFCFSSNVFFRGDGVVLYDYDFFQALPHSEWVLLDLDMQEHRLGSFLEKELVFRDAFEVGLNYHHKNFLRFGERVDQLLVNSFYERVVAGPYINPDYLNKTKKYIGDRVFVYHLLLGFSGGALKNKVERSKNQAFFLADSLKSAFVDSSVFLSENEKISLFKFFADRFSDDPSSSNNSGQLGWVSWGQVMPSFQEAAFSSPVLQISNPVLTDYGYHLVLVEKRGFSDYHYYDKSLLGSFSYKFALHQAPIDSLRVGASVFDSLFLEQGNLKINEKTLNDVFLLFSQKTKVEKLRGGKNMYIAWLEEFFQEKRVLFVFNNKGFGLGWFVNKLLKTPSTRVPSIKKKEDLLILINSFLLREGALREAYSLGLDKDVLFKKEVLEQNKNILYKAYKDYSLGLLPKIDSSLVVKKYEEGKFNGEFVSPQKALFSEVRVSDEILSQKIYSDFLLGDSFEDLMVAYGGSSKEPVSKGRGVLPTALFSMKVGEVSPPLSISNGTFSVVRLDGFVDPVPFELKHVYVKIEKTLKKNQEKRFLFALKDSLLNKFDGVLFREFLSY